MLYSVTLNVFGNPAIDIFFVTVVTIFLILLLNLGQSGVYKKNILTVPELFYIVNLALLAIAAALARQVFGKPGKPAIYTSCAVALVTFIGTLVYHVKEQVMKWCKIQNGDNGTEISLSRQTSYERLDDGRRRPAHVSTSVIEISSDDY